MENFNSAIWEKEIYGKGNHFNKYPFDNVVSFIYGNYPKDKKRETIKILEVGCGAGNNLWFASREGFNVTGIDGSTSAIDFAKERFLQEGLQGNFMVGDFTKLSFEDCVFDLLIDRGSITCCTLNVGKQIITEVNRVLIPGGLFFFNPYSTAHTSFTSANQQKDNNYVEQVIEGDLVGVGGLCFYNYEDIVEAFKDGWEISTIKHKKIIQVYGAKESTHAEWEVIAKKI